MRILCILLLLVSACTAPVTETHEGFSTISYEWEVFPVNTSIRALEVSSEGAVWYAGANGRFGYSTDNGKTWTHDSVAIEDTYPEFRSIAVTSEAVMIMSVGSPALLLRSTDMGETWNIAYREDHEAAFYDAMSFWDDQEGIAMGDPTDGCLSVIITRDGGQSWNKISCSDFPAAEEGEAAFAASNTNISVVGDQAWIASGGARARVLHTTDRGETWQVYDTPIIQGGTMTGIFSMDFYDADNGIVFGGDWERKYLSEGNKARSVDGGRTWELLTDGKGPGYRSCVQYIPGSDAKKIFAVGIPGVSYSSDGGDTWQLISDRDFYTVRTTAQDAWLAGNGKVAHLKFSDQN